MLRQHLHQVAYSLPDALRPPFESMVAVMRPQLSPLLNSGYYPDHPVDIVRSSGKLLPWAQRVAIHYQIDPDTLARETEADLLAAGIVDWHHDEAACFHSKRMLIAYPGIEGFVLHIAHDHCHSGRREEAINKVARLNPSRLIRKSVPLTPGTVCFIDHEIYHSVSFDGDLATLDGAPATLFFDFGLDAGADA